MLWVAPGCILGILPFLPDASHFARILFILFLLPLKRRASPPPATAVNASVSSSTFSFSSSSSSSGKSRINSMTCSAEVSMPFSAAAFKINSIASSYFSASARPANFSSCSTDKDSNSIWTRSLFALLLCIDLPLSWGFQPNSLEISKSFRKNATT